MFAVTKEYTPLFNTERIDPIFGNTLAFDHRFLLPQVETVLFPGIVLEVLRKTEESIEVKTKEYPSTHPLFVDKRSITFLQERPKELEKVCPTKQEVLERLRNFPKCAYIWGGTNPHGIPHWTNYYPPKHPLSPFEFAHWTFRGVDCSGLLQWVTDAFLPRNTSDLLHYGYEVTTLKPLDLILYPGHVLVVLPGARVIECRHLNGVAINPLKERLKESEDLGLTFRRWI